MKKELGMGRTRGVRLAAIAIPAGLAAGGLALGMLNGLVGATLASANGFGLSSTALTTNALALRNGAVSPAGSTGDSTLYAQTNNTSANGLNLRSASVTLPLGLGAYGLEIKSSDPAVALGNVTLNAKTLNTSGGASLSNINVGQAQSDVVSQTGSLFPNFNQDTSGATDSAYNANGFALTANANGASTTPSTLSGVTAAAYAIHLSGLNLSNLQILLQGGTYNPVANGVTNADF